MSSHFMPGLSFSVSLRKRSWRVRDSRNFSPARLGAKWRRRLSPDRVGGDVGGERGAWHRPQGRRQQRPCPRSSRLRGARALRRRKLQSPPSSRPPRQPWGGDGRSSQRQPRAWAARAPSPFIPTEGRGRGPRRRPLRSRRRSRARTVPVLRHGPFCPDDGLAVGGGSDARKIRPWRTPSSSAEFALLPRPAPHTKNCAAIHSPVRCPLSLAPRPSLPLLSPVQQGRRKRERRTYFPKLSNIIG